MADEVLENYITEFLREMYRPSVSKIDGGFLVRLLEGTVSYMTSSCPVWMRANAVVRFPFFLTIRRKGSLSDQLITLEDYEIVTKPKLPAVAPKKSHMFALVSKKKSLYFSSRKRSKMTKWLAVFTILKMDTKEYHRRMREIKKAELSKPPTPKYVPNLKKIPKIDGSPEFREWLDAYCDHGFKMLEEQHKIRDMKSGIKTIDGNNNKENNEATPTTQVPVIQYLSENDAIENELQIEENCATVIESATSGDDANNERETDEVLPYGCQADDIKGCSKSRHRRRWWHKLLHRPISVSSDI
ncbi:uncharacterized protein LOC144357922 [Saccoglossus kowalevskii]